MIFNKFINKNMKSYFFEDIYTFVVTYLEVTYLGVVSNRLSVYAHHNLNGGSVDVGQASSSTLIKLCAKEPLWVCDNITKFLRHEFAMKYSTQGIYSCSWIC
jgi:hypothetical protein